MSEDVIETLSIVALMSSLLGPPVVGFWLFRRAGHGLMGSLGRATWMMLLGVIPIMAVGVVASIIGQEYQSFVVLLMPLASFGFFWRLSRVSAGDEATEPKSQRDATDADVISAYAAFLETSGPPPGCIADESKLPYPKQRIETALFSAIRRTSDAGQREALAAACLCLPDWQKGVGPVDVGIQLPLGGGEEGLLARADLIVQQSEQLEKWLPLRNQEEKRLAEKLRAMGIRLD